MKKSREKWFLREDDHKEVWKKSWTKERNIQTKLNGKR